MKKTARVCLLLAAILLLFASCTPYDLHRTATEGSVTCCTANFFGNGAFVLTIDWDGDPDHTVIRIPDTCGGQKIRIFAKIENQQGMAHLESLFPHADEIIIARGDLGNAVTLCGLPAAQKEIAGFCDLVSSQLEKNPRQVAVRLRLMEGEQLLRKSNMTVDEISEECHFASPNFFISTFYHHYRMTPADYRRTHS